MGNTIGQNANTLLDTPFLQWAVLCGEQHASDGGDAINGGLGFWREAEHQDGAGGLLLMGITGDGRADVCVRQTGHGEDAVWLRNQPGAVYLTSATGARHQVVHRTCLPHERLQTPSGPLSMSIIFRSSLFAGNRARLRDATPTPTWVFEILVEEIREALGRGQFRLPALQACFACQASRNVACDEAAFEAISAREEIAADAPREQQAPPPFQMGQPAAAPPNMQWAPRSVPRKRIRIKGKGESK